MSVPDPATTKWVPMQGARLGGMAYWGSYEATRTYYDGDCAIGTDGILYMCTKDGTVGVAPTTWPGRAGPQGAKGDTGAQGIQGVGVPMPVVNGQWIKGVGGAAVWTPLLATEVPGLVTADTNWHYVGQAGEPPFQNGWSQYGGGWPIMSFRKDATGWVSLSGLVTGGTVAGGTPIFTLPAGYRPVARAGFTQGLRFPVVANNAFGASNVYCDGRVDLESGSNGYVFLVYGFSTLP